MFEPMNFLTFARDYMLVGMLGVFMIVGVIMAATYLVGKIGKKD